MCRAHVGRLTLPLVIALLMLLSGLPTVTELPQKEDFKKVDTIQLSSGDMLWSQNLTVRQSPFWISLVCPSESNCEELNLTVTDSSGTSYSTTGRFHLILEGNLSAGIVTMEATRVGITNQELIVNHVFFDGSTGEFIDAPSQIPNPSEDSSSWPLIEMSGCGSLLHCGELDRAVIDSGSVWWNGSLDDSADSDSFRLNSSDGDLVEVGIIAHSTDLSIEIWSRTNDDLQLVTQEQFISGITNQTTRLLLEQNEGELWVRMSTFSSNAGLYSLRFAQHSQSDETEFGDATSEPWTAPTIPATSVSGHLTNGDDGDTIRLEASSRSQISVDWWLSGSADIYFQARLGTWNIVQHEMNITGSVLFVVPVGADAASITINNSSEPLIWKISITNNGPNDGGVPGDASDSHPTGEADTLGWTLLQAESSQTSGSIGGSDIRDVYLISREEGFPNRSWLTATIEADPGSCSIKLVEMNTSSYIGWQTISWNLSEMQGQQANVGLELPHGRHLMVVESNSEEEVEYTIDWSWITPESEDIEEGVWVDYSSKMNNFYIIVAILLLSPWILIAYWRWKSGGELELEAHEKRRLERLRERLTAADPTNERDPHALLHALESLADTNWEALLAEWGEPLVRHTTESLDLVIWELSNEGTRSSLTVGLTLLNEEWTLAAIRFQAVEGSEWNVSSVVPDSLFDGDEVFLGDLKPKSSKFLRIDLEGEAKGFDLILSGLVGGKPVAAVPTKAALLEEE